MKYLLKYDQDFGDDEPMGVDFIQSSEISKQTQLEKNGFL